MGVCDVLMSVCSTVSLSRCVCDALAYSRRGNVLPFISIAHCMFFGAANKRRNWLVSLAKLTAEWKNVHTIDGISWSVRMFVFNIYLDRALVAIQVNTLTQSQNQLTRDSDSDRSAHRSLFKSGISQCGCCRCSPVAMSCGHFFSESLSLFCNAQKNQMNCFLFVPCITWGN